MMKILWLASWYPNPHSPYNGDFIQRHARALALHQPVTVFYVSQSGEPASAGETSGQTSDGLTEKIIFFNYRVSGFSPWDKLVYNYRYYTTYKRAIRDYISKAGVPDIVHVHIPIKAGRIALWMQRKWQTPFIVSEHSAHYRMGTPDDFFSKPARYRKNVRDIFRKAVAVTNVSFALAKTIREIFSLRNDAYIIRNTADTRLFTYRPVAITRFRFLHVSTLNDDQKNISGLLRAIKALALLRNDFELVITGPVSREIKEKVAQLSLSAHIQFTGEIPYAAVALQMQQASVLVLFSRYENFPCVVIEALCCGLPVISSDVGGIKEAVDESNGTLVASGDEKALTQAMSAMIDGHASFDREQIAQKAAAQYSYAAIGGQLAALYKDVLETHNKGGNS